MADDAHLAAVYVVFPGGIRGVGVFRHRVRGNRGRVAVCLILLGLLGGGLHLGNGVALFIHGDVFGELREPVKGRVGKLAGGRSGVVQDVEIELAVVLPNPGAPPDDLFELAHGIDDAHDDDIFAGRRVYPGSEQLGGGENDRRGGFQLLKPA